MLGDVLGHLEHADEFFASEDDLQIVVGVDHRLFDFVLQFVLLDVVPEPFRHLSAGSGLGANNGGESGGRRHRLHERGIGFPFFLHHFFLGDFFDGFFGWFFLGWFFRGHINPLC